MQRNVPIFVLLPQKWNETFQSKDVSYPVIMNFHANYNSYAKKGLFLSLGCVNDDVLVVFPDGDLNTYYMDSPIDPRIRLETFIVEEMRPVLIQKYKANPGRKWATMGISSGGFGSMAISMKHRDKFCAATSFGGPFIVYDMEEVDDKYTTYRFGDKSTVRDNYIPFNLTWIAEDTKLQDKQLNMYFVYYSEDQVGNNHKNSLDFHNYLDSKNISHMQERLPGKHHIDGWEEQTINKFYPFILDAFKNLCS